MLLNMELCLWYAGEFFFLVFFLRMIVLHKSSVGVGGIEMEADGYLGVGCEWRKGNEWVEGMFFLIALCRQIWYDKHARHVRQQLGGGKRKSFSERF